MRIAIPLPDRVEVNDQPFEFRLPQNFYATGDGSRDGVTISARGVGNCSLPDWLVFDPDTLRFSVNPPTDFVDVLDVEITVEDSDGNQAVDTFRLLIMEGEFEGDEAADMAASEAAALFDQALVAEIRALWNTDSIFGEASLDGDVGGKQGYQGIAAEMSAARFGSVSGKIQSAQLLRDATMSSPDCR